ncbi:MAG: hypothetical protein ACK45V_01970 [Brevundimonas sp.]|jgi:hypothetical protein
MAATDESLQTTEVRWFISRVSRRLDRIAAGPGWCTAAPRTDRYLSVEGNHRVGLKLRDGKLEIKVQYASMGPLSFSPTFCGVVQRWSKWSSDVSGFDGLRKGLLLAGTGIDVRKHRRLLKLSFEGGAPLPVDLAASPMDGCTAELTELECMGQTWWTFGLEAYGELETQRANLISTAIHLCADAGAPELDALTSCSYPQWVHRLAAEGVAAPGHVRQ